MSCSLFPYDETAEAQVSSIKDFIDRMGKLLDEWIKFHEKMFPKHKHTIPNSSSLTFAKANGLVVSTDTCNCAKKMNAMTVELIKDAMSKEVEPRSQTHVNENERVGDIVSGVINDAVEHADVDEAVAQAVDKVVEREREHGNSDIVDAEARKVILTGFCHHHLRNIWMKAIINRLSSFLSDRLSDDLSAIDAKYRVEPNIGAICRQVYKMFSLNCNYAKGLGEDFRYWLEQYHPDALLVPLTRMAGSREDSILNCAVALYYNLRVYDGFTNDVLGTPGCDNLLLDSIAIVIRSEETIALCRVCAIVHYSISLPMRWLAANTHTLYEYNWSVRSMGRAIDLLYEALIQIKEDGAKLLDETFMFSIFAPLRRTILSY